MKRMKIFALISLLILSIVGATISGAATTITLKGKGNPFVKSDEGGIRAGCDGENSHSCELTIQPDTAK